MMKKSKISLWKWALGICMLFAGVQSAWAQNQKCAGTAYVKAPAGWDSVYVSGQNGTPVPGKFNAVSGFYQVDLSETGADGNAGFSVGDKKGPDQTKNDTLHYIDTLGSVTKFAVKSDLYDANKLQNAHPFACPGEGERTFVSVEKGQTNTPPGAKYFFVMIPPDFTEWMSAVPMLSLDGGKNGKPMQAVADMCGWYSYEFFGEAPTDDVILYRDDDELREDMLGANGNWETDMTNPKTIALSLFFDMGSDTVFFVPDEEQKTNNDGFYFRTEDVQDFEGKCDYTLAALIYDTDASLHPAFSCYASEGGGEGCQNGAMGVDRETAIKAVQNCIGITPGLVEDTLNAVTKKPKMSKAGAACFINEQLFNLLFNYTAGANERRCYDMPFTRAADGKWEFDSDFYHSPGANGPGGFYPVETSGPDAAGDALVLADDPTQQITRAARTKRDAEGPVFYGPDLRREDPNEGMPIIDILCNGPGWKNGRMDCDDHLFGDGSVTEKAIKAEMGDICVFGWSCDAAAPKGWTFFKPGTDTPVSETATTKSYRWSAPRNQHYCFESHAKFTYKKGLKFNFRGDDDIWVFIDNKLAVDLGGTHLAAPGYVDLDEFLKGRREYGDETELDIFFCDRRTTMSNVRIKTNMYIRQKTNITSKETKTPGNKEESTFSLCYTKSGDGSCVSALTGNDADSTLCGAQLNGQDIGYFVVNGFRTSDPIIPIASGVDTAKVPGVYLGGIDLTTLYAPKIDTKKFTPPPGKGGTFSLFVVIDGKAKRLKKWRITGEVDVVYADAKSYDLDSLDNQIADPKGDYKLKASAMGGELVEVYISAVTPSATDAKKLDIIRPDAIGISYTLDYPKGMKVYVKNAAGELQEWTSETGRTIGETGIDTVYVTVPMELLQGSTNFEIGVKGRDNKRSIKFYMPKIKFVDKPAADWSPAKEPQNPDGSYDEHWVGSYVSFYLAVLKPVDDNPTDYELCEDCDLSVTAGVDEFNRNEKIELSPDTIWFENGFASFSVRSQKAYRYDADPTMNNPAAIVVNGLINGRINDYIRDVYTPIYFREPPVPYPVLADVFDVEGAEPAVDYNMPSKFKSDKYLDGIGDSVVIYYDRRIHKDSLPTHMCILWDSLSAKSYLPAVEGWSNSAKDSVNPVLCNEVKDQSAFKCLGTVDAANYCDPYVTLSGLTLSSDVKTSGVGHVYSYAKFIDKCVDRNGVQKCDTVKAGFDGEIIDRIAPVPVSAVVRTLMNGDELGEFDSLVVLMSEPVKLLETVTTGKNRALDFYLNSAIAYDSLNRYSSALGNSSILVEARGEPVVSVTADNKGRIKYLYSRGGLSPHVGDYARLGGDLSLPLWSDTTDYHRPLMKGDSIRNAINAVDAPYFWNSPTGYAETTRLPSRWVLVTGDAEIAVIENNFGYSGLISRDSTEPVTVHGYRTTLVPEEVFALEGRPGHLVKADMFSLINGLSEAELQALDTNDVYFEYAVEYYTNLGSFVVNKKDRIYCNDSLNKVHYFTQPGSPKLGKCTDAGNERNFFIGWNMLSNKGRMVGTGAYIVKLKSFVKMGGFGKKAKQEKTSVWGAKRGLPKGADLTGILTQILQ